MPTPSFWTQVKSPVLNQGDLLSDCRVPIFFGSGQEVEEIPLEHYDLIVVSQSCDLENRKIKLVACCPIFSIRSFEVASPSFGRKGEWEQVRQGRREGLHLLASPTDPDDNQKAWVVDFREIYSLPFDYLTKHAQREARWRLLSPYLEHFSQSFARFFMRVGLPSAIPRYA
jgi:hypothetical protein